MFLVCVAQEPRDPDLRALSACFPESTCNKGAQPRNSRRITLFFSEPKSENGKSPKRHVFWWVSSLWAILPPCRITPCSTSNWTKISANNFRTMFLRTGQGVWFMACKKGVNFCITAKWLELMRTAGPKMGNQRSCFLWVFFQNGYHQLYAIQTCGQGGNQKPNMPVFVHIAFCRTLF